MRKIMAAALAALLLFVGCASNAVLFENDFDELDILGRTNEAAAKVFEGKNIWLEGELYALREDVEGINTHGSDGVEEVKRDFINCMRLLSRAYEKSLSGDSEGAEIDYQNARIFYIVGDRRLNMLKSGGYFENEE